MTPQKPKEPRKVQSQLATRMEQEDIPTKLSDSENFGSPEDYRRRVYRQEKAIEEMEKKAVKEKVDKYKDVLDQMVEEEKNRRKAEEQEMKASPQKDDQLWKV